MQLACAEVTSFGTAAIEARAVDAEVLAARHSGAAARARAADDLLQVERDATTRQVSRPVQVLDAAARGEGRVWSDVAQHDILGSAEQGDTQHDGMRDSPSLWPRGHRGGRPSKGMGRTRQRVQEGQRAPPSASGARRDLAVL